MIDFFLAAGVILFVVFLRMSPTDSRDLIVLIASIMSFIVAGSLAIIRYLGPKYYNHYHD